MLCTRCGGLLIENWWEIIDCMNPQGIQGTRCVNCGCIEDPVIRANRRQSHRVRMTMPRGSVSNPQIVEAASKST